jgi:hypothetical protein
MCARSEVAPTIQVDFEPIVDTPEMQQRGRGCARSLAEGKTHGGFRDSSGVDNLSLASSLFTRLCHIWPTWHACSGREKFARNQKV